MRRDAWVLAIGLTTSSLAGCQKIWGFDDFEEGLAQAGAAGGGAGGAGAAGGAGGAGTGGSAGAAPCTTTTPKAGMVGVRIQDGSCVWIDAHEVTRADYLAFMLNPPATLPGNCQWNSSFDAPEEKSPLDMCTGPGEPSDASTLSGELPVTCVDWCDAYTFCSHQGKTLCPGKLSDLETGAWFDICSGNGKNDFSYSKTHQVGSCNDNTASAKALVPVTSKPECTTETEVFDLVGNASEWIDACDSTGENAECAARGGSYKDGPDLAKCAGSVPAKKKVGLSHIGFRCCWTP